MNNISFPGLGLSFTIDSVAFSILGKDIYWYGIIIATGFMLAVIFAHHEAKRIGFNPDYLSDFLLWVTPAAIIGARLYYVAFKWDYYAAHPDEIIAIWNGGIAIYGAVIASVITALIFTRKKGINRMQLFDIGAMGLLIGQSIGRWGNFVNREAFGYETSLPWRMEIYSEEAKKIVAVHPTFFYESLWNAAGFVILFLLRKRKPFDGFLFWAYLTWYGLGRVWVEGLRTDSLYLGSMRISQIVALVCIFIGIGAIYRGMKKAKHNMAAETDAIDCPKQLDNEGTDK